MTRIERMNTETQQALAFEIRGDPLNPRHPRSNWVCGV